MFEVSGFGLQDMVTSRGFRFGVEWSGLRVR